MSDTEQLSDHAREKIAATARKQLMDNLAALRQRRANHAEAQKAMEADTEALLLAGQAAEPPVTYDDLSELTGLSRSRVAQIIQDAKKRAETDTGPAKKARARAAAKSAGVPASLSGKGGVAVAELVGNVTEPTPDAIQTDGGHSYELDTADGLTTLSCSTHGWKSESIPTEASKAYDTVAELVDALAEPHQAP